MFKKPLAHQSNATPLRSSARRQLVSAILAQYPSLLTPQAGTKPSEGVDEDGGINEKELGKMILPDGVRSCTFETSAGVEGTFYLSTDGEVLWMSFGRNSKEYIPTLSLLSLALPSPPLPVIQLHHPIPPPLLTGAPLFIPAVRNLSQPHYLPDIEEDGLVAFVNSPKNSTEDVSYVGVGRIVAPGGMKEAVRRRLDVLRSGEDKDEGKFSDVLCIIGDHLWDLGSKPTLPSFPLPIPTKALAPPPQQDEAGPSRSSSPTASLPLDDLSLNETAVPVTSRSEAVDNPLDSSEISTLLSISLLQALTSLHLTSLPIPASLLYSAHVLPNRPAYIPKEKRDDVVIAKSEWKKLAKWMKEVGKEGLLKVKETKGEAVVTGFDPQHPSLQNHAPFTTIAEEDAKAAKKAAREAAEAAEDGDAPRAASSGTGGKGKGKEIVIEEMWKPSGGAISFWEACDIEKSSYHHPTEMKSALDGYIAKHDLRHADHRYVLLDDELGKAVGIKRPDPGDKMARDEIMKKLRAGVAWSVSVGGVMKKGTLQPITLTVKTRQGRKTITHVTGLETFSIDVDSFAEEMRKVCAGSASVQPLSGASPKLNLQEVLIQGNQIKLVTEALVGRGVPKKWIKEGEDSKKGGKK